MWWRSTNIKSVQQWKNALESYQVRLDIILAGASTSGSETQISVLVFESLSSMKLSISVILSVGIMTPI